MPSLEDNLGTLTRFSPRDDRPMSLKQQIEVLYGLGIRPTEIAEILGRTSTHINKELSVSGIRRKQREK
jgi:hypothetical protein